MFILLSTVCGCMLKSLKYDEPELVPYLSALGKVQKLRDSCGFTPLSNQADISLEGKSASYDAMLHIYQNNSSHTIAFKTDNDKYVWIGEQEVFTGPEKYETADGSFNETITLTYEKAPISGHRIDSLDIEYMGPDNLCRYPCAIPINDMKALIKTWSKFK